jgi:large subunit ribosomal protein L9
MKVYLKQDVPKLGLAGEIIKVSDGYAQNFLFPKKLAVAITPENQESYEKKQRLVDRRKEVIETETSMLAEKIRSMQLTIKRKMHEDQKLYGAISQAEVADLLAEKGVKVAKNQVVFNKSIKEKGLYDVTIKLSSRLQPSLKLKVMPEERQ